MFFPGCKRVMMSSPVSSVGTVPDTRQTRPAKLRSRSPYWRRSIAFWGLMGPMALGLLVFFYIPLLWGFVLSFFQAQATVFPTVFVGFDNYRAMLSDYYFLQAIVTFALFALF